MGEEESLGSILRLLPFLIPLALVQLALMVIALVDVLRREQVRGNRIVWILVVVFINIIGPIVYFVFGRKEALSDSD